MKRSNDNRSYSCHYCPRQFLHSSQLQEHETSEHNNEPSVRKPNLIESTRSAYEAGGKELRSSNTGDHSVISDLSGTVKLSNSATLPTAQPPPPRSPQSVPLSSSHLADSTGNCSVTPLRTLAAGLSLLHRAFISPDFGSKTHADRGLNKSIESSDIRLNGIPSTPTTTNSVGTNSDQLNPTGVTSNTGIISNGTSLDSFGLGTNQCDLCLAKYATRTELEHHMRQHFTQCFGKHLFSFTLLCLFTWPMLWRPKGRVCICARVKSN